MPKSLANKDFIYGQTHKMFAECLKVLLVVISRMLYCQMPLSILSMCKKYGINFLEVLKGK